MEMSKPDCRDHSRVDLLQLLPKRLYICGVTEVNKFVYQNVTHSICILDPDMSQPWALKEARWERLELRFHDIIECGGDLIAPQVSDVRRILEFGQALAAPRSSELSLLIYCGAGISRSTAAMLLLLAQANRCGPAALAMRRLLEIQPHAWPNRRMVEFGDQLLGYNGELIAETERQHLNMKRRHPSFGHAMTAAQKSIQSCRR